mmetsp:Transcript_28199/g.57787  ORF Transcript_28199/g.57787 Transcript_28199/m.57787 type:complete len:108 (+) Transcript_28199:94-417(+)
MTFSRIRSWSIDSPKGAEMKRVRTISSSPPRKRVDQPVCHSKEITPQQQQQQQQHNEQKQHHRNFEPPTSLQRREPFSVLVVNNFNNPSETTEESEEWGWFVALEIL